MSNKDKFKIVFDEPSAGWIGVKLTEGERECAFPIEHVPNDTIKQLADGLGNLLSVSTQTTALANDGPIEYELVFKRMENLIDFRCFVLNETPLITGKQRSRIESDAGL
jgi:hypothetical protein